MSALPAVASFIRTVRDRRVIVDSDLAILYGVETKQLNRAVKRNLSRFPDDFMFQLSPEEAESLRCQIGTSKERGGRRYLPYAFTQEGVAMLSGILQSPRAAEVNVAIMRAFVRLRQMALSVDELQRKMETLEKGFKQHGRQFEMIFNALRELMAPPPAAPKNKIGFHP